MEFMVIAAPRSGTAWMANWLTTAETHCIHDPLWGMHYDQIDGYQTKKRFGIACTGIWRFPVWVHEHPAKKLIVHRPLGEIVDSLDRINMPHDRAALPDPRELDKIRGMHVSYRELFVTADAKRIWEHLIGKSFDEERFRALRQLRIERDLTQVKVNPEASRRLIRELIEAGT